jgi:glucokinase
MAKSKPIVGIDLGGTNMQIGVVDGDNAIIGRSRKKTQALEGRAKVIDRIVEGVNTACEEAGMTVKQLGGLGIGAPGAIDPVRGVVLEAVNLRWNDVALADILKDKLGIPVIVDNDVNVAIFGEWQMGSGRGVSDLLGVWIGTGIGGGLILRDKLYEGALFTAGEIGHTVFFPGNPMGSRSLEENCSRTAVADRLVRLIKANHQSKLAETVIAGDPIKSKLIAEAYESNDSLTHEVVDEVARHIGIAVANVVTLLSLPRVVLGGGLTEAIGKPFVSEVKKSFKEHVFPDRCRQCEIVASELEDDAGLLGAALLARLRLE